MLYLHLTRSDHHLENHMNLNAEIAAYRQMIVEAKAAREAEGLVEGYEKLDAQYERVAAGDLSDCYRLAGATAAPMPKAVGNDVGTASYGQGQGSYSSSRSAGVSTPRVTTPKLASDKQIAFATTLLAERETEHGARLQADVNGGQLTSKQASDLISWLLQAPKKAKVAPVAGVLGTSAAAVASTITDGFYELDGTAYKVQLNLAGTSLYGKKLVDGSWEFVPGIVGLLTRGNAQPLSEELAATLGHLYGSCVICSRRLTDEGSIAKGIGPVCAAKQGW